MLLNRLKSQLMDSERLAIILAVMEKKETLNNRYSNIVLLSFIKHMDIHTKIVLKQVPYQMTEQ